MSADMDLDGNKFMKLLGRIMVNNLRSAAVNKGVPKESNLLKSIELDSVSLSDETITVVLNDYFRFVELGRRKGARLPPPAPILDWLIRYRIAPGREKQILYAIRHAISLKGIKPRPFIDTALTLTGLEAEELFETEVQAFVKSLIFN